MSESYVWAGGYFSYDGSNGDGFARWSLATGLLDQDSVIFADALAGEAYAYFTTSPAWGADGPASYNAYLGGDNTLGLFVAEGSALSAPEASRTTLTPYSPNGGLKTSERSFDGAKFVTVVALASGGSSAPRTLVMGDFPATYQQAVVGVNTGGADNYVSMNPSGTVVIRVGTSGTAEGYDTLTGAQLWSYTVGSGTTFSTDGFFYTGLPGAEKLSFLTGSSGDVTSINALTGAATQTNVPALSESGTVTMKGYSPSTGDGVVELNSKLFLVSPSLGVTDVTSLVGTPNGYIAVQFDTNSNTWFVSEFGFSNTVRTLPADMSSYEEVALDTSVLNPGEFLMFAAGTTPAPCPPFWQAFLRSREVDLCGGPEPEPEPVSITGYVELATGQVQANPNFVWAAKRYVQDGLAIIDVNFRDLHKTVLGTAYDIETGMNGTATQILAMPTGWDTPAAVAANPAGTILNVLCKLESDGTVAILTLALSTPFDLDTASVSYSTVVPIVSDLIVRTFFFTDEGNKIWTLQRFSRFIEHSVSAPYEAVGMTPTGRELDIYSDVSAYDAVMVGDTDLLVADIVRDRVARFELTVPGDLESAVYKEDLASNTAPSLFLTGMVNYPDLSRVEFAGGASIFSYGPPA